MKMNLFSLILFFIFSYNAKAMDLPGFFIDVDAKYTKNGSRILLRPFLGYLKAHPIEYEVKSLEEQLGENGEMVPHEYFVKDRLYSWAILDYKNNNEYKFVGLIQSSFALDTFAQGEYAELSIFIYPDFRRMGFAYQSCVELMKHLLHTNIDLVGIVFAVANTNTSCESLMAKFENEFGFIKSFQEYKIGEFLMSDKAILGHRWFRYFRGEAAKSFVQTKRAFELAVAQ
jgi:RimJ/RimL family protein N-acetyltransferase